MTRQMVYFYALVAYVCIFYLYYFLTRFERVVTINEEFVHEKGSRGMTTYVSASSAQEETDIIYVLTNVFLLFSFRSAELVAIIEPKKKYNVTGYGIRVPFLGIYPVILSASEA